MDTLRPVSSLGFQASAQMLRSSSFWGLPYRILNMNFKRNYYGASGYAEGSTGFLRFRHSSAALRLGRPPELPDTKVANPGLLSNQGEKSINFYFIRVPLRKKKY